MEKSQIFTNAKLTTLWPTSNPRGWFFDLVPASGISLAASNPDPAALAVPPFPAGSGERAYINPIVVGTTVFFTLNIPSADQCTAGGTGSIIGLDPLTGSSPDFAVFDVNGDGLFNTADMVTTGGVSGAINEIKRGTLLTSPLVQTSSSTSTALDRGQTGTGGGVEEGKVGGCSGSTKGAVSDAGTDTSITKTDSQFCGVSGRVTWRQLQ